jgi:hypothetical protein
MASLARPSTTGPGQHQRYDYGNKIGKLCLLAVLAGGLRMATLAGRSSVFEIEKKNSQTNASVACVLIATVLFDLLYRGLTYPRVHSSPSYSVHTSVVDPGCLTSVSWKS